MIVDLGESTKFTQSMCEKTSVIGLGIVLTKKEINGPDTTSSSGSKILQVIMQHTDYDPVAKAQVEFKTMYHIGGRKNLANTFGLFQLSREILISGNIVGYTEQDYMWIVAAISVSVTSGHQSNVSQLSRPSERPQPYTRRPGLILIEDSSPAEGSSLSPNNYGIGPSDRDNMAEPEPFPNLSTDLPDVSNDNYYESIPSTTGKKRTKRAILADAKRAAKASTSLTPY
ncbi:uncharacterized protein PGTG_14008 [Puccinia graminis f. sp. tritici CRL 75-36-700-3]|uniref:Uncharacterized protein n=1 Tax=Puccinia graminis f. sp. tritici (strain CRL 75-36-700-3 / race SCCL) TaxID=418459 RepID=E3KVV5_PUCGT|nr:uncharacterized protein PGTG_14008 [Puccinia graminis f. sp. tritici CRL 75-36-700-3]EFP88430.2 hypothetical protein PGTG_14008 [Puccinia graminis f. sp. tritici CRL 75-36-700-3]